MAIAVRVLAAVSAVPRSALGFGVIDLAVTVDPSPEWRPVALLDGGWGLFVTFMIAGGFAALVLVPPGAAGAQ